MLKFRHFLADHVYYIGINKSVLLKVLILETVSINSLYCHFHISHEVEFDVIVFQFFLLTGVAAAEWNTTTLSLHSVAFLLALAKTFVYMNVCVCV